MKPEDKRKHRQKRAYRVRRKLRETSPDRLRLSIFRSHQHIYAQLIDDNQGITLAAASDADIKTDNHLTKTQKAHLVGRTLGDKIKRLKKPISFFIDRGPHAYHGRVKALIEGLRQSGLKI
ncbi:MAG: 50S ribosomal protein L18 [bacterium]|nr:50S ribosomal protein L18 [bacterium]